LLKRKETGEGASLVLDDEKERGEIKRMPD